MPIFPSTLINVVTCPVIPVQVLTTPIWCSTTTGAGTYTCSNTTNVTSVINATGTNGTIYWDMETYTPTQTGSLFRDQYMTQWVEVPMVVEIEEEDWLLNHDQYLELARNRAIQFRVRTAAMRAEQERAQREAVERAQRADDERKAALKRSLELLVAHLRPEQRETLQKHKWFVVEGGKSKTQYRIRDKGSPSANVDVLNKQGNVTHRLCAHGSWELPLYDHLLMQKILLQYDEQRFLAIANRHAA